MSDKRGARRAPGHCSFSHHLSLITYHFPIYEGRDEARAEAVVYVDDRDVRGAGVEHAQKRRDAAERRAVADARRHGDDGRGDEYADDRGERALHAGRDDDDAETAQALALGEY